MKGMVVVLGLVLVLSGALSFWDAARDVHPAPVFRVYSTGLEDGANGTPQLLELGPLSGQTVVLDLMAVTCLPCREVARDVIQPLYDAYRNDSRVAIWSIDAWADPATGSAVFGSETEQALRRLQVEEHATWPHALDTDQIWLKFGVTGLPRVLVVDGSGHVVFDEGGIPSLDRVRAVVDTSLAGASAPVAWLKWSLPALAVVAGVTAALSPCAVGLLPAYFALVLSRGASRRGIRAGLGAAGGALAVYAVLAVAAAVAAPLLVVSLPWMTLALGFLFVFVGAWTATGRGFLVPTASAPRSLVGFGAAYGLASFGCSGPLFLPILVAGFSTSLWVGFGLFLLYAASLVAVLVAIAMATSAGAHGPLRRLSAHGRKVQVVAGLLVAGAGIYLLSLEWGRTLAT